ncbi:uncharacterized protein LOC62_04G005238 [Vanrija pseudolonga]|uniref:Uncharacterized protein n=1 Tax=Vanrija pseudolonga TaxID=143232 RepID=A0AAF1BR51_9TREE|nr:hypothetical protein LOC62_04G005238 [Vanrija pseudolonga]
MVLDHTAFPLLIDYIIGYADMDSLLAWRGTSRMYRDRINRLVFKHVVIPHIEPVGKGYAMTLGMIPEASARVPPLSLNRSLPFAPAGVTILDIPRVHQSVTLSVAQELRDISAKVVNFERFTNLHTLRRSGGRVTERGSNFVQTVTTVVDFPDQDLWEEKNKAIVYLPHHVRRYVLHLKWANKFNTTIEFKSTRRIRDWVLVLHHAPCKGSTPGVPPDLERVIRQMARVFKSNRSSTVTFVGAERINPRHFGAPGAKNPAVSADRFKAAVERVWEDLPDEFRPPTLDQRIQFLTYDDWLLTLGDKKDIEGRWLRPRRHVLCSACEREASQYGGSH